MGATDSDRIPAEPVDTSLLDESVELPFSKLVAKNRLLKAPMTEDISTWDQHVLEKRGIPTPELTRIYEEWGKGGYGIVITGNTIVNPVDVQAPGNAIIYKPFETPERLEAFSKISAAAKRHGSLAYVQLNHAGRQIPNYLNPNPVSASDVQLEPRDGRSFGKPTALTKEGIDEIVEQFAYSAEFCHRAGFDGVEIHCAHGYLLAQFLSSTTNKRTDDYGGSLANRARIISRIITAVRERVPSSFSVGIKINSVEFQKGGFQPEECAVVCAELEGLGLDFIELSGGTYEELAFHHKRDSTKAREAFFSEFANIIRPAIKSSKLCVTGGFRTAKGMVSAVASGETSFVGLGRPTCEEPNFGNLILSNKVHSARTCLIPPSEDVVGVLCGGMQITMMGHGEAPFSTASVENMGKMQAMLGKYMVDIGAAAQEGKVLAGYPYTPGAFA